MLNPEQPRALPNGLFAVMTGRVAWLCFGGALAGIIVAAITGGRTGELPKFYLIFQDTPVLLLLGLFCLAVPWLLRADGLPSHSSWIGQLAGWRAALVVAGLAACAAYAGAYLVYRHFGLSLDEFMAEFDARIIASGHLLAPVAPEWREYVPALQPIFRLAVPENAYWISSYLPTNAAIRAFFLLLGDPALEGALLAAVALLALFGVARRLWPDRPDAAVVAVLLLACSSQFLITAMTPYAMTAHLALNLVWLWLFLRDTRTSHALAATTGFVACGLHQVIFHPLFAAPFLLTVLRSRKWKLAAFYAAAYAVIGLFWILYWKFLLQGMAEPSMQSADLGFAHQLQRIAEMVQPNSATVAFMGLNLFRFVAWQAPLAIPLALVGFVACQRQNTFVRDLALGILLTLAAMTILMPHQGHGWGYRYLHGLLGSLSLLAAQGWICLSESVEMKRKAALLLASLLVSVMVAFPWYAYQTRNFVLPYASAVTAISRSDAQVVLVEPMDIWAGGYGADLVRNDPLLRISPKVMALGYLNEASLQKLCRSYDVAFFDRQAAAQFGLRMEESGSMSPQAAQRHGSLRQIMTSLNCGRRALDSRP